MKYDFVAIGGGNTGLGATSRIAAAGHRVALIDRGNIGGLCSLNGCNPKKVLVRSSEVLNEIRHAGKFGIDVGGVKVDWNRVIDRKESFTRGVTEASEKSLQQQGIDLIKGSPRFVSRNAVEVNGDRVEASAWLISTGSTPQPFSFPGAELLKISDDILALREVPEHLVIIGAGVVAFEFGQVFARLGSRVTFLVRDQQALSGNEQELVEAVVEFTRKLGAEFIFQASVQSVKRAASGLMVAISAAGQTRELPADFVLNAAGRVPSIASLDLAKAEVKFDGRGIEVNDYLRSPSNPGIFAGGDAHGRMQLSPIASYEGRVVARNFLEKDTERVNYEAIPRCIYTVPPLASVGITEAQAAKRDMKFTVHTHDMAGWKVYGIMGEEIARAKIIIEKNTDQILGAHIYGANAGDEIHFFALAMAAKVPASSLKNMVFAYPTFSSTLPYVFD